MKTVITTTVSLTLSFLLLRCVIIELFCDGVPPFDLSQLLNYSCKNYSPWKLIDSIPDNNIKVKFLVFWNESM